MSVRTRAQINDDADTHIPDNTSGLVEPEDVRQRIKDLADSTVFPDDLASVATSGNYDDLGNTPDIHNIPAGGTTGQVLKKSSGTDYDVEWDDESGGGGGGSFPPSLNDVGDIVLAYLNHSSPGNVVRGGTAAATYLTPLAFTQTGTWLTPKADTALTTGTYMNIGGRLEGASNLASIWRRVA